MKIIVSIFFSLIATLSFAVPGDLDPSFGNGGIVMADFFGRTDVANNIRVTKSGQVVVAGSATLRKTSDHFAILRLDDNGAFDKTFDGDGKLSSSKISEDKILTDGITGLGLLSNDTIVAVGRGRFIGTEGVAIVSYRSDGVLNDEFGEHGVAFIADERADIKFPLALVVDSNNNIIVASASYYAYPDQAAFSLMRFNSHGILDATFGIDGRVTTRITNGVNVPRAMQIDSSGNIVVGGFNGNNKFVVARYQRNGSIDDTFAISGIATIPFNAGGNDTLSALAIQQDGKIVVGGDVQVGSIGGIRTVDFGIARLLPNGTLDLSFNSTGTLITYFTYPAGSSLWALAIDESQRIIAVGDASIVKGLAVARINNDGTLDQNFANGGKKIVHFKRTAHWEAVALHNNKIIVSGYVWNDKQYDMSVVRINNE